MPILAAEPSIYPLDLLSSAFNELHQQRSWYVLHTKPRQEKAVLRQLVEQFVPSYLPLHSRPRLYQGRKVTASIPLFPGYVFLFGDDDERLSAVKTNRIVRVLLVMDQIKLCRDLVHICHLLATGTPIAVESRLQPGRHVRIRSGIMRGLEGVLISRRGEERLIVAVDFLQQGASVALDDFLVEPLD